MEGWTEDEDALKREREVLFVGRERMEKRNGEDGI